MQEERVRCLASLGKTPNAALVKEALQFGLSVEVRRQDTFYLFGTGILASYSFHLSECMLICLC